MENRIATIIGWMRRRGHIIKNENFVIDIKEASPSDEFYKDNWYVILPNHYYKIIFGSTVKGTDYWPWKKKIVRIYSHETKNSIHRIFKGAFRAVSKTKENLPIIRISSESARILKLNEVDSKPISLTLSKGSRFMFYWNHFDAAVRSAFKLGFVALLISVFGLLVSGISLLIALLTQIPFWL